MVIPPDHAYDVAPLPDKVTDDPVHTVDELAVTVTVGNGFTVIVFVAVFVQPFPFVPVTVYVVVDVATNPIPFVIPPDHTYDVAPLPDNVTEDPAQTVDELAVTVTVGRGFTVIVFVALVEHPLAVVPVTVYVVVDVGTNPTPSVTPPVHT